MKKKQFKKFSKFWYSIPKLDHLEFKDKIISFLNGSIPELDDSEREILQKLYSREFLVELNDLKDEVIEEIDWNLIININKNQLEKYHDHLHVQTAAMCWALSKLSYIDDIDAFNENFSNKLQNRTWNNRMHANLLMQTLENAYSCYRICESIKERIEEIKIDLNPVIDKFDMEENKTLRDLFADVKSYELVFQTLIDHDIIYKNENTLTWKGLKKGAKYEIGALQEALYHLGLIQRKCTDIVLSELAENTFRDFKVNPRTLRGNRIVDAVRSYIKILNA